MTAEGRDALAYAERRGLSRETLKEFRIGFAPQSRDTLKGCAAEDGFHRGATLEGGLLIKS